MKSYPLFLLPLLCFLSCYNHDNITERIRVTFDFETGYVWDSKTGTRQPFTASSFGGFYDDGKLTLYTDIYAIDPLTLVIHGCEEETYVARDFGSADKIVVQPSNVVEIWIKGDCARWIFGKEVTIDLDLIYEFGCPSGN